MYSNLTIIVELILRKMHNVFRYSPRVCASYIHSHMYWRRASG